jgi:hypothetical protein
MIIGQKPVFWAFYSPSSVTRPLHDFGEVVVPPNLLSANKINRLIIFTFFIWQHLLVKAQSINDLHQ